MKKQQQANKLVNRFFFLYIVCVQRTVINKILSTYLGTLYISKLELKKYLKKKLE